MSTFKKLSDLCLSITRDSTDTDKAIVSDKVEFNKNVNVNGSLSGVFTGFIQMYGGSEAPAGWLLCDGTTYNNADYPELAAVLGTTYGGTDGSTFAVPNFGARVPVGSASVLGIKENSYQGRGTITAQDKGYGGWPIGEYGGEEYHTLKTSEMPSHSHTGYGSQYFATSDNDSASNAQFVISTSGTRYTDAATEKGKFHHYRSTATAGGGGSHNICQPYITVNYIICAGRPTK